jgi:hypothetical protein
MLMYSDTIRSAALASVREEDETKTRETIEGPEFTDGCSRTGTRPVVGARALRACQICVGNWKKRLPNLAFI